MGLRAGPVLDDPRGRVGAELVCLLVGRERPGASDQAGRSSPLTYFRLVLALGVLSILLVGLPGVPTAAYSPLLAAAMAAIHGAIGVALLQLGLLRFSGLGCRLDLFAGLAFGMLAVANLGIRLLGPVMGGLPPGPALGLVLLLQALAASLFVVGPTFAQHHVAPDRRRQVALRVVGVIGLLLAAGIVVGLAFADTLSGALDAPARALVAARAPVFDFLAGQAGWLLLADGLLALLFGIASVGHMRASWRLGDPQTAGIGVALLLLCFAHVHALLFPPVDGGYISSADVFRLGAYLAMLFNLVAHLATEIAERAAREERLRLSRDLHDGLAQELSLMNLRLIRAALPDRPADARARDLEAAQRLLEAALLEARQGIAMLRTGHTSWEEFARAVASFADEFAANHDVAIAVKAEGELPPVDTQLQLELLRVLQEAFSNAVRHGRATRLDLALHGTPAGLRVRVRDNGRGFDLERALVSKGVGLDSMVERVQRRRGNLHIDSQPGGGATVHVWLPVADSQRLRLPAGRPGRGFAGHAA